jgi:hypothetical protein
LLPLCCALLPGSASGDNVRPVYLDLEELPSGKIRVVWKVPLGQALPPDLKPSFPQRFQVVPPKKQVRTGDAVIETWEMVGGDNGLAGAQIRIDGLRQTTTDGLVRIRLADGSVHRAVLRPTETATRVPQPHAGGDEKMAAGSALLRHVDRWRYGILFTAAFVLSLMPAARRRGILLCAVALVAGALCGHALGRLPVYDTLLAQQGPSRTEAAKILQGLMLNTYRAFMLQRDEDIYDTLARSVSGEFLSEVYLQNRESLRMGGSEGALVIVHQLDIKSIDTMERNRDGSITMVVNWDVYGSVHHQRHVHYRCNTYTAQVTIEPSEQYWKLVRIQLLDEQRVL